MVTKTEFMTEDEARGLVETYIENESAPVTTQEILDSGVVPRLNGYRVQPGKVSDSIFGGSGGFKDKATGEDVKFENPPLETREGVPLRFMARSERISAGDVNRGFVPFKDQVLAINHNLMRRMLIGAIGTSQFEVSELDAGAVVIAAENLKQIRFENVLRSHMAETGSPTSLYQAFFAGKREFCGHRLLNDLIPNGPLPYVMDTPSTKSDEHDESLSSEELIGKGICTRQQYGQIRNGSLVAYGIAQSFLGGKGIILADTKLEHGTNRKGNIVAQDEIITMDSSRFWRVDDYNEKWEKLMRGEIKNIDPIPYSKEVGRRLSKRKEHYTDEQRVQIAVRYIEGIQHLTGRRFEPDTRSWEERVVSGLQAVVERLVA